MFVAFYWVLVRVATDLDFCLCAHFNFQVNFSICVLCLWLWTLLSFNRMWCHTLPHCLG